MDVLKRLLPALLFSAIVFYGCKKDEETTPASTPPVLAPTPEITNNYSGSASYGDLMTFEINQSKKTYKLHNETTGKSESGSYVVNESKAKGLYAAKAGGESFYAVELDDKIIASNFPSGNSANQISFGVSSEIDNTGKEALIAGDYIYVRMGNVPINGSMAYKEWGIFTATTDGKIHLNDAASGGSGDYDVIDPETVDQIPNLFPKVASTADYSGAWSFHSSKKGHVNVTLDGATVSGYAYVAGAESVFLIDLGTGKGFALAYKITSSTLSSIAGEYKFVDTWNDGTIGAGVYNIAAGGTVSYYHVDKKGTESSSSFGPLKQLNQLSNVYVYYDAAEQETYYLIVTGDAIMHFIFNDNGEFQSYGAGARI